MATESRRQTPGVVEYLFSEPHDFEFFEAVRLLKRLLANTTGDLTEGLDTAVRFRSRPSLEFPASAIHDLKPPAEQTEAKAETAPEMTVAFLGLTGPSGVLPRTYTETVIERQQDYSKNLKASREGKKKPPIEPTRAFLDLFNHRLIALFYEAWEKYHFFVGYERGDHETFTRYLLDLVGMGTGGLRGRRQKTGKGLNDQTLVYYSGLLAQTPHSAAALTAILSDYFDVEVRIEQFCGRWLSIPEENRTRLGHDGRNTALGKTLVLGDRTWDQQSKFRVRLGPLSWPRFTDFLPDGKAYGVLQAFIRFFVGPGMDFEIQLVVKREDIRTLALGAGQSAGIRLGWSTWISNQAFTRDAEDAIFPSIN